MPFALPQIAFKVRRLKRETLKRFFLLFVISGKAIPVGDRREKSFTKPKISRSTRDDISGVINLSFTAHSAFGGLLITNWLLASSLYLLSSLVYHFS